MFFIKAALVCGLVALVAHARPHDFTTTTTQSPEASYLGLPASADEALERTIDVKFSCAHRRLGYYADVSNGCKVFHICNPTALPDGQQAVMQYSFFCPANTTFDQQSLTCVPYPAPVPCNLAEKYYHVNDQIGVTTDLPEIRGQHTNVHTTGVTGHAAPIGTSVIPTFHAHQHQTQQPQQVHHQFQTQPQTQPQPTTGFHATLPQPEQQQTQTQFTGQVFQPVPTAGQGVVSHGPYKVLRLG